MLTTLLVGCAATPPHRVAPFTSRVADSDESISRCAQLITAVDDAVERAQVRDGAAYQIPGHPYWRADRLLIAARNLVSDDDVRRWLRSHDREARTFELENLPPKMRQDLIQKYTGVAQTDLLDDEVNRCADLLSAKDVSIPKNIAVPDDYQTWKRVLGLYALTRVPFASGIRKYQRETELVFATPLDKLPVAGTLKRTLPAIEVSEDAIGVDPRVRKLFVRHAPVLEIDVATSNDAVGAVTFGPNARIEIDTQTPTAYIRGSHAIVDGKVLTQLIYSFWFSARPKAGALDLLGGHLDGIIWRVTLAPNGDALLYDTIHNCGCFHQFFPTSALEAKPRSKGLDEWAFMPQRVPRLSESQRVVLRVASGSHYIQRISVADGAIDNDNGYRFMHDDSLRSLPLKDGGRRSLFQPNGIVPGTERGERYLFWPMGVREPGAMRQWGRHATAFVGRRHFDDPLLLDQYFEFKAQNATDRTQTR